MNLKIREAIPDDYLILSDLGRRTFYETWRPVNTEEDMQSYLAKSFASSLVRHDIENINVNLFYLAFIEDEAVGYSKMRWDRSYDEFNGERAIEIERIYVLQSWQAKKIGKELMDHCLKYAIERNFQWLWLGVNIDNHKAIDFYKKYDFEIFGEKSFQLGEAVDNDYLMKRKL